MTISDFGEGWVTSPIEHWTTILLKSGLLFWLGGLLAYAWYIGWDFDFVALFQWVININLPTVQTLLGIFALLVFVSMIANIVHRFELPMIYFLEGHRFWPNWLYSWRLARHVRHFEKQYERIQELTMMQRSRTMKETRELNYLHTQLRQIPRNEEGKLKPIMPTRFGNRLYALEQRSEIKYGLDIFTCWSHLWFLMPAIARQEVARYRYHLDTAIRIWIWGALFSLFSFWACWAIIVSLLIMWLSYRWMLQIIKVFDHLVETSFDLYRFELYQALRFPLPKDSATEIEQGQKLTQYLKGRLTENVAFENYIKISKP